MNTSKIIERNISRRILLLISLLLFCFISTSVFAQSYQQLLTAADQHYTNKQYKQAAEFYEKAALDETNEDPEEAYYNSACSYALAGDVSASFDALFNAVKNGWRDFDGMLSDKDLDLLRAQPKWNSSFALMCEGVATVDDWRKEQYLLKAACAWAVVGNKEKAYADILLAVHWGDIKPETLEAEKDLAVLRSDLRWKELINSLNEQVNKNQAHFHWGLFFGMLFFLFIYNLFMYLSLREPAYFYYSFFIFSYVQFEAIRTPAAAYYLKDLFFWLSYLHPASSMSMFVTLFALIFLLLFGKSFLNLKMQAPFINRIMNVFLIVLVILVPAAYLSDFLYRTITFLMVLLVYLFTLIAGVYALYKGYRPARFFVLGMAVMTLTVFWVILGSFEILEKVSGISVFHIDNIGTLFFSIILSLAIGDKINILKGEKENAQAKALEVLEEKVQERTLEVVKQKHAVEEKQKEIIDSINYAKRIQRSQLPTEKYIDKCLKRLKDSSD